MPELHARSLVLDDGKTVAFTTTGIYRVLDEQGAEILQVTIEHLEYDGDNVNLIDPESGELVATVSQTELDRAMELLFREIEPAFGPGGNQQSIVFSRDGREWQSFDMSSIGAGGMFYPQGLAMSPNVVVMTGFQDGGPGFDFDGPPPAVIWVGTVDG